MTNIAENPNFKKDAADNLELIVPNEHKLPQFKMIKIEGGKLNIEGDKTPVEIKTFYMAEFTVTQDLYRAVMVNEREKKKNPSYFKGDRRPVEQVSWFDAVQFCNRLSGMLKLENCYQIEENEDKDKPKVSLNPKAKGIRLPSETEWEFAARGGNRSQMSLRHLTSQPSETIYAGSDNLDEVGWYTENSHSESKEVGLKFPNSLGLYDMSGNVWEWCQDDWQDDFKKSPKNGSPFGDGSGSYRVVRGGSWGYHADYCRVADRSINPPEGYWLNYGFRVVAGL